MPFDERAYQYVSTYLQDLVHQKTAYLLVMSNLKIEHEVLGPKDI